METTTQSFDELRDEIRRVERNAGIRASIQPSDLTIRRRRAQIGAVALIVFVGLLLSTVVNDVWTSVKNYSWLDPALARLTMIAIAAAYAVYVLDKERSLKRLANLGQDLRNLDSGLGERLVVRASLAESARLLHQSLDLDVVLRTFLDQAIRMVGGERGSIVLLNTGGELRPAVVHNFGTTDGAPLLLEDSLVLRAVLGREPILMGGTIPLQPTSVDAVPVASVICVPFEFGGKPLGAITLGATDAMRFEGHHVELLSDLAADAAVALDHARRFEAVSMLLDNSGVDLIEIRSQLQHLGAVINDSVCELRIPGIRASSRDCVAGSHLRWRITNHQGRRGAVSGSHSQKWVTIVERRGALTTPSVVCSARRPLQRRRRLEAGRSGRHHGRATAGPLGCARRAAAGDRRYGRAFRRS